MQLLAHIIVQFQAHSVTLISTANRFSGTDIVFNRQPINAVASCFQLWPELKEEKFQTRDKIPNRNNTIITIRNDDKTQRADVVCLSTRKLNLERYSELGFVCKCMLTTHFPPTTQF